jgi:hypothetical protein
MTKVLVGPNNPDGWKLEELLEEIQNDILRRSAKIVDDARPEPRAVLHNNIEIMQLLTQCLVKAHESTCILNSLGPSGGTRGGRRLARGARSSRMVRRPDKALRVRAGPHRT